MVNGACQFSGNYAATGKGRTMKKKLRGKPKVAKVMREFSQGKLRSGSKKGPKVTNPAQAKAIAMSEAGMSKGNGKSNARRRMPAPMSDQEFGVR